MNYWGAIICGLLGMGTVLLVIPLVLRAAQAGSLFRGRHDLHHTHRHAVPRLGGLALAAAFVGVAAAVAIFWPEKRRAGSDWTVAIVSSLAMFALGFWDDLRPLGARRKLAGQILIALCVSVCGVGITHLGIPFVGGIINLGDWGVLITVVWLVGMTNLINLIDGVDGLAGGICLMLMSLLAYVGYASGGFGLMAVGMAGALLGFLWFNFPPARIYLGDGGAYLLGFQIGLFAILSAQKGTVIAALVAPLFVLALPIVDTALAILRRGLRGLPIFRPDRRHLHHHLLRSGMSRRRVVLSFYGVTLIFLAMGFMAYWSRGNLVPVLLGGATLILLLCAGRLRFSRNWFDVHRVVGSSLHMRQQVHYALALARWLTLEGSRRRSAEELWSDLVFAAQRLGYSSVKVTLADGEKVWERSDGCPATQTAVETLQDGRLGTLELKASCCDSGADPAPARRECEDLFCPCVSDEKVFEIVSELLAEGWAKALSNLQNGDQAPVTFATRRSWPANGRRCGSPEAAPRSLVNGGNGSPMSDRT